MPPPRVLFLSARVGVGHTAAARAVERALHELEPGAQTCVVDSYEYAARMFATVVADGYITLIKTLPKFYGMLYDRVERATQIPAPRAFVNRYTAKNLRSLVERFAPDVVVCTHAFPCGVMSEYKRLFAPGLRVVGVVTDFVVHPYWIYANIDAYAVATPEMRDALLRRGVAAERIVVSGIPVDARFGAPRLPLGALRDALALPRDRRVVLMMGGGLGLGPIEAMIRALAEVRVPLAGAIIIGRNRALERRARAAAGRAAFPLRVVGFVDNVYDYMHASDVLLSKPGGLTSAEALAAELPMVLARPLPGQEERNTAYLVSRAAALPAFSVRAMSQRVAEVLEPARNAELRRSLRAVRRPLAAREVAVRVRSLCGS